MYTKLARPTYLDAFTSVLDKMLNGVTKTAARYIELHWHQLRAALLLDGLIVAATALLYYVGVIGTIADIMADFTGYSKEKYWHIYAIHGLLILGALGLAVTSIPEDGLGGILFGIIIAVACAIAALFAITVYRALEPLGLEQLWLPIDIAIVLGVWAILEKRRLCHQWEDDSTRQKTRDDRHEQLLLTAWFTIRLSQPTRSPENHGNSDLHTGHISAGSVSVSVDGKTITGLMRVMRRPDLFQFRGTIGWYLNLQPGSIESITTTGGLDLYPTPWPETHPGLSAPTEKDMTRLDAIGKATLRLLPGVDTDVIKDLVGVVTVSQDTITIDHCLVVIKRDQPVFVLPGRKILPLPSTSIASLQIEVDDGDKYSWDRPLA